MNALQVETWNRLVVDLLVDNQILGSTVLLSGGWRHPWSVTPNFIEGQWTATIEPGFVNGLDASVSMPADIAPAETLDRLKIAPGSREIVDAWLSESPALPLSAFRAIGRGAAPVGHSVSKSGEVRAQFEPLPAFFRALGAGDADNSRLLLALDLVLYQDQPGLVSNWTTAASEGEDFIARFSLDTVTAPHARRRAYINQPGKWKPTPDASSADILAGDFTTPTHSEWLLASVYLLSPAGASFNDGPPGADWEPFVAHSIFWNRLFAAKNAAPPVIQNLSLRTGLAFGLGDRINDFILGQINDANSLAQIFLAGNRTEGMAWTI